MSIRNRIVGLFFASLVSLLLTSCGKDDSVSAPVPRPEFGHFRWPSFPVEFRVQSSILNNAAQYRDLLAALAFWERHANRQLFLVTGNWEGPRLPYSGAADAPDSISSNAIIFGGEGVLEDSIAGLTALRVNGETILGAVILLDPSAGLCEGLCEGSETETSLRRLMAHELGHFLGMAHSPDPENIMYPMIRPGGALYDRNVDENQLQRLTQ